MTLAVVSCRFVATGAAKAVRGLVFLFLCSLALAAGFLDLGSLVNGILLVVSKVATRNDLDGVADESMEVLFQVGNNLCSGFVFEPFCVIRNMGFLEPLIHVFNVLQKKLDVFLVLFWHVAKADFFEVGGEASILGDFLFFCNRRFSGRNCRGLGVLGCFSLGQQPSKRCFFIRG